MKKCSIIIISLFFIFAFSLSALSQTTPTVGYVFSGGGARGLAHIGALKVLEAEGIVPQYIGGASMGSIVGSLYAAGYSAEEIEFIFLNLDWNLLLTDYISRRDLAMNEKDRFDKYALNLPLRKGKVELPKSLTAGQNISKMLSRLMLVQNEIDDFDQLPIPFLCTATDLQRGEEVLFTKGYLPDVVRASMSIPTVFTPKKIDNLLLVDGGVTNNFPVQEVKNKGAQIIIGMNVEMPADVEYLNSFTRIMEQSIFLGGRKRNEINRELCDVLIEYDLRNYSAGDFAKVKELIEIGEQQARKALPEIRKLVQQKNIEKTKRALNLNLADIPETFKINEVLIEGNKRVSQRMVKAKLRIRDGKEVSLQKIEKGIDRVYGSDFFETATYRLQKNNDDYNLHIRVQEKDANVLRIASHFDTDYQASILMNVTLRNFIFRSSKLYLDAQLSMNPIFNAKYYINIFKRPELNLAVRSRTEYLDLNQYSDTIAMLGINKFFNHISAGQMELGFGNSLLVAGGLEYQIADFYLQEGFAPLSTPKFKTYNYFVNVNWDTYDRLAFPTKGSKIVANTKLITGDLDQDPTQESVLSVYARYSKVFSFLKRFTVHGSAWLSYIDDQSMLPYYTFAGGIAIDYQPFIPFVGLHAGQVVSKEIGVLRADVSLRLFENHYITYHNNILTTKLAPAEITKSENWLFGTGISYDYNSIIGPIGATLMISDYETTPFAYVHVGYSF